MWIASYPKSGNTWLRAFLNCLFLKDKFNLNNMQAVVDQFPKRSQFKGLIRDFNNLNEILSKSITAQKNIIKNKEIKLFKTHSMLYSINDDYFTNKNLTIGVIYLVRDPRNVFLSLKNHIERNDEETEKFFFNEKQEMGYTFNGSEPNDIDYALKTLTSTWKNNYLSWKNVPNILIVKYENLISKPEEEFIKITNYINNFIKKKITNEEIVQAIKKVEFNNLQKIEKDNGFIEKDEILYRKKQNKFFNLGPKTSYKESLNEKIRYKIEKNFKKEMIELGYLNKN